MSQRTALWGVAPARRLRQAHGTHSARRARANRGRCKARARERARDDLVLAPRAELERHRVGSCDVGEGEGVGCGADVALCLETGPAAGPYGGMRYVGL